MPKRGTTLGDFLAAPPDVFGGLLPRAGGLLGGNDFPAAVAAAPINMVPLAAKGTRAFHGTMAEGPVVLEARQPALGMKAVYASTNPDHAKVFAQYMGKKGQVIPLDVNGEIASRKYVLKLYDDGLTTEQIRERLIREGYVGFYEDSAHEGMGIFDPSNIRYTDR